MHGCLHYRLRLEAESCVVRPRQTPDLGTMSLLAPHVQDPTVASSYVRNLAWHVP